MSSPLKCFILVLISAHLVHAKVDFPNTKVLVIGGQSAREGQFPWQVQLTGLGFWVALHCGGSLISQNHVLTAAHCVDGVFMMRVKLGIVALTQTSNSYTVFRTGIKPHPGYNSQKYNNDIAILVLPELVIPTAIIQPIILPMGNENYEGRNAVVSGWGRTRDSEMTVHNYLQFGKLKVMNHRECEAFYWFYFKVVIGNGQLCTTFESSSVCNGDSGGPLVVYNGLEPTLIGVVSLGVEPCEGGGPSVYAAVASYLPWISSIVK